MTLSGRFRWLLETMCQNLELDGEALVDNELDYWENKANIETAHQVKLGLVHFSDSFSAEDKYQKYQKYYAEAI